MSDCNLTDSHKNDNHILSRLSCVRYNLTCSSTTLQKKKHFHKGNTRIRILYDMKTIFNQMRLTFKYMKLHMKYINGRDSENQRM